LVQKSSTFDVTVAVISNETFDWYLCLLKIVYVFLMLQLQRNQEVYNLYEMTCLKNGENWINIYPFFCHFFPSSNLIFLCIIFCVCCNAQRSEVSYEVILFFSLSFRFWGELFCCSTALDSYTQHIFHFPFASSQHLHHMKFNYIAHELRC
jgi:hypothetical protein